jgi:regulator of protease activity HflC (stomatin/prohibitin superfamily)
VDNAVLLIVIVAAVLFVLIILRGAFFTVRTAEAAVVERFGKFKHVANAGLNFKVPIIEKFHRVNLMTQQLEGSIETKTKDNVFVTLPVKVQYRVIKTDEGIADSYYKLAQPTRQIEAYLYNILLGHIPDTDLDEVFITQPKIAERATTELSGEMKAYGYEIVKVLITDIIPDAGVKTAMNRINEEIRNKSANEAQGDAEKVLKVKQAEADAEVKRLQGQGVAMEREAIAEGWKQSIGKVKEGTSLDDSAATFLLLYTNWTDMLRAVGTTKNSTMVFMPSGPEGLQHFQQVMTNSLLSGVRTAVTPEPPPKLGE